ncbi:VOC family protein [Chachezhania antarctica]|uniref:VOC family protein n=1 Tax=Chachezhania antarctica TaxID=2340860 RepID=UPI000EAFA00B|nr:VOC family protein [Chachezhania antarctica]
MTYTPRNAIAWMEIPVTDMDKAMAFYSAVTQMEFNMEEGGPNPMAMFKTADGGVAGHLYPGKPAPRGQGPTIHLSAPDKLEAVTERVKQAGGTVISPPIPIPNGRFFYAEDPDGNSIGFVES